MTHVLAAAGTTNAAHAVQVVLVSVGIPLVVLGTIAVIVVGYFRLQAHRADAVAMANYRKLAEDAVANQEQLRNELSKLTEKVAAVEKLMRDVG
jgi:fatty-acid desaturase